VNYAIYDDSCANILSYVTKVELNEPAGLPELNTTWKIWQVNGDLHVLVENETQIQLFDMAGTIFLNKAILAGETLLKLEVAAGIYMLSDQNGNRHKFYFGNQ
jgi:hypothetical protein